MKNDAPTVIFLGQPNSGKSTMFNAIAGPKALTSNFPGTSYKHTHSLVNIEGRLLNVVDLPGTYSLNPSEPAEKVILSHLFQERPDLVVNVVDGSTLGRSLELTLELLELGFPVVIALNMVDLAEKKGIHIDVGKLEQILKVRVVPTVATHGRGIKEVLEAVFSCLDNPAPVVAPPYSGDVEQEVDRLAAKIPVEIAVAGNSRFTAIKLLEAHELFCLQLLAEKESGLYKELDRAKSAIENKRQSPAYEVIAAERHHLAFKIFEETSRVSRGRRLSWEQRIDDVIMHPVLGYPILVAVFLAFFFLIFKIGSPLEGYLLGPLGRLREALSGILGSGLVFHLADGLIQGIGGGAAIVLPYFIPLLFFMAFLEDLGYLSRAGFLLDTFMHRIGLHGKSVSPFVLAFGCNVPAVLSTRILESRRDREITSLLIPFIPCSARTTIILALVAFFLGPLYALGFYFFNLLIVAVIGRLLSFFYKAPSPGLILEIPSLKAPSMKNMARKTYLELKSFVIFAWPLLVGGSILLSLLHYLKLDRFLNIAFSPLVVHGLGLPQELGITLVFGFLRKELSLIMMLQALGVDYQNLLSVISREQILVFTVFVSFFIPCLSTFAILWKESGRKIALISVGLSVAVALAVSFVVRLFF
ncbi:MAG: ferrous iron transport protein B [Candidatus Aminicenantes bacterium]|nr:ferrous iron transport protein B [Candidatus Aminicenantes bacterium]